MNANELADLMEDMYPTVSTMLRQQASEIELLRQGMKAGFDGLETMTALSKAQAEQITGLKLEWQYMYDRANMDTPLPMPGLTDEEVKSLASEHLDYIAYDEGEYGMEIEIIGELDFYDAIIKAINKKAMENPE